MNELLNQVRRLWSDDGRNDKDFSKEEIALKAAKVNLDNAISEFTKASTNLYNALLKM